MADVFVAKISNIRLPVATLSAASTSFPNQLVGSTSSAQRISLTNDGDATLNINSIVADGDFRQANTCASLLPAGATCAIDVSFAPVFAGDKAGTLTIADDAYGTPHVVALTGTGVNPVPALVSVSPLSAMAGGVAFNLTVSGSNFVPGAGTAAPSSVVRWKGADRPTVFVNGGQLMASIPDADLDMVGAIPVYVESDHDRPSSEPQYSGGVQIPASGLPTNGLLPPRGGSTGGG